MYADCVSEVRGLKRKLSSKLSVVDDVEAVEEEDWQVTMVFRNVTNCSVMTYQLE